jgi:hypothetical protein
MGEKRKGKEEMGRFGKVARAGLGKMARGGLGKMRLMLRLGRVHERNWL